MKKLKIFESHFESEEVGSFLNTTFVKRAMEDHVGQTVSVAGDFIEFSSYDLSMDGTETRGVVTLVTMINQKDEVFLLYREKYGNTDNCNLFLLDSQYTNAEALLKDIIYHITVENDGQLPIDVVEKMTDDAINAGRVKLVVRG